MDGYLLFDTITPQTRDALFQLVDDELLRLAAVTVSGSAAAFAVYEASDLRAAYATVEAVTEAVGRPRSRLLAVHGPVRDVPAPGTRRLRDGDTIALAFLSVPPGRAAEVAAFTGRVADDIGLAVVVGAGTGVVVEVSGHDLESVEPRLADLLTIAGAEQVDVLLTSTALTRGWQS